MKYKRSGHAVFYVRYHLVISTKYRRKIFKANTARDMREQFPFLDKVYWGFDGIWSVGYFVSTVGMNEKIIIVYIQNQGQEDSGQATLELS